MLLILKCIFQQKSAVFGFKVICLTVGRMDGQTIWLNAIDFTENVIFKQKTLANSVKLYIKYNNNKKLLKQSNNFQPI